MLRTWSENVRLVLRAGKHCYRFKWVENLYITSEIFAIIQSELEAKTCIHGGARENIIIMKL